MNLLKIDENIFLYLNGFVGSLEWLDRLVGLVVNEYFVPVTLALIVLFLWAHPAKKIRSQSILALSFFSVLGANLIVILSNLFIDRARPFEILQTNLLFYKPTDPSFPSNAAAVSFALALAVFSENKGWGVIGLILATFYSFSRVYAGVHFPSDVLVGALIGTVCALFFHWARGLVGRLTSFIISLQSLLKLEVNNQ